MRAYAPRHLPAVITAIFVAILVCPCGGATAQPAEDVVLTQGARNPAVSPQGEVVFGLLGDLWIRNLQSEETAAVQLTSGSAWERDPAWGPEGERLYELIRECPARKRGDESCGLTGLNGRSILARK